MSFKDDQLIDNLKHFIAIIHKVKPSSVKGVYLKKCVVAGSMSPSVQVNA
jgi:ribosomal protein L1